MGTKTCWHYDVRESGTCPECNAAVTVEDKVRATVEISGAGGGENTNLTGSYDFVEQPTARQALAIMLGVGIGEIVIEDVTETGESWERGSQVVFHIGSAKGPLLVATVKTHDTTTKTPYSTKYEAAD